MNPTGTTDGVVRRPRYAAPRLAALAFALSGALGFTAWAQESSAGQPYFLRVTGSEINVRRVPDVNSLVLTRIAQDGVLVGVEEVRGWHRVMPPPDVFSFVAAQYVEQRGERLGMITVEPGYTLNVRPGSTVNEIDPMRYARQAKLKRGDLVEIIGATGDWYKIAPPRGVFAYVSSDYVERIDAATASQLLRARGQGLDDILPKSVRGESSTAKPSMSRPAPTPPPAPRNEPAPATTRMLPPASTPARSAPLKRPAPAPQPAASPNQGPITQIPIVELPPEPASKQPAAPQSTQAPRTPRPMPIEQVETVEVSPISGERRTISTARPAAAPAPTPSRVNTPAPTQPAVTAAPQLVTPTPSRPQPASARRPAPAEPALAPPPRAAAVRDDEIAETVEVPPVRSGGVIVETIEVSPPNAGGRVTRFSEVDSPEPEPKAADSRPMPVAVPVSTPTVVPTAAMTPVAASATPPAAVETITVADAGAPTAMPAAVQFAEADSEWDRKLREVDKRIEQEARKPVADRAWSPILYDVRPIATQIEDPAAAELARARLEDVNRRMQAQMALRGITGGDTQGRFERGVLASERVSETSSSANAPFAAVGILRPSLTVQPGPYGLRYQLEEPATRRVRAYVEFPPALRFDTSRAVGGYVGVQGTKVRDPSAGNIEVLRATTATVLSTR